MMPRLLVVVLLSALVSGCYVLQAASGQWEVIRRSRPIEQVLSDPSTPAVTRRGLELTIEARAFAEQELALPESRSYRHYADLGRPYVVWNVVATHEFSVEPRRWCFPVAGCVSYRGYFKEPAARAHALKLASRGDDVSVGGVPTYSTLGHLPDPVFDAMLGWRDTRLVATIFHELAHERLYVAGDSEFNEAFASVVEEEGLRQWLQARGRAGEIARFEAAGAREDAFAKLLLSTRRELKQLYASDLTIEQKRIEKQREIGKLLFRYERLRAQWDAETGAASGYDAFFRRPLNNAHLASVATYRGCMPGLRDELASAGSLSAFYVRGEELAALTKKERHERVCRNGARQVARAD